MTNQPRPEPSFAALRNRRYRDRQKAGKRCINVELDGPTLEALVSLGFLNSDYAVPENSHALVDDIKYAVELLLTAVTDNGIEVSDEWIEKVFG